MALDCLRPRAVPLPPPDRARSLLRLRLLGTLALIYASFAWLAYDRPLPAVCPYRLLTGLRCPLCGLTTAFGRLLHGDLHGAFQAHPLALPSLVMALAWYCRSAVTTTAINRARTKEGGTWQPLG
ncbi:MAG: DUF2752 domain-containing protein [Ktedonobacterales bacterium]